MASPKSVVVLSILFAYILLLSLQVDATRELTEQTHKASKVPEEEEKMTFGFFVGNNNDNQPGNNGYPGNGGGYIPGINGYPINGGYLPGNGYFGYGGNPGSGAFFPFYPRGLGRGQYPGYGAYARNP